MPIHRASRYLLSKTQKHGFLGGCKNFAVTASSRLYMGVRGNPGEPIWEKDWDILLILDACRTDLMEEVAPEYEFIESVDSTTSIASKSPDWIRRTFAKQYQEDASETAYITGNPFTAKVSMESTPKVIDEVWKYAWDDDLSTIPARPITDRAIDTWRDGDAERMIVHYMQPHVPFVPHPDMGSYGSPDDFGDGFDDIWGRVGDEVSYREVWDAYRDNLEYVLNDVELLLSSVDAERVALCADHGNAIGEWSVYGHPPGNLLPQIRRVPWVETTASNVSDYQPMIERSSETVPDDVGDRLRHLGYTE